MTFQRSGTYHVLATLTDTAGLSVTSTVDVVVAQTATALAVTPGTIQLSPGSTQAFSVSATDQFGLPMTLSGQPTWTPLGGTITSAGVYTAGTTTGPFIITATLSGLMGKATATIARLPVITTAAHIDANPVTAASATLSAAASDPLAGGPLTYHWEALSGTPLVQFLDNDTATAATTTVSFNQAGSYTVRVTATTVGGLSAQSTVSFTVVQTFTTLGVDQASAQIVVAPGSTTTFTATAWDQFLQPMTKPSAVLWSVTGGGNISSAGVLTAAPTAGGPYSLVASIGSVSSGAYDFNVVTPTAPPVVPNPPRITVAAQGTPNPVSGTTAQLTVTAADDQGTAGLTYTWRQLDPSSSDSFSPNGTNAARSTTVTFGQAGVHVLAVTVQNAAYKTVTSTVQVTVLPMLTALSLSPAGEGVVLGETQSFTASAKDQFQRPMALPALSWTCTTGDQVSGSGLFTGNLTGPYTVTATGGGLSASASGKVGTMPTVATAAKATPAIVTGKTTTLSVLGADTAGESGLTYVWSGSASFSINGTNAAKTTTATFFGSGMQTLTVTITNAAQVSITSQVTVEVDSSLTSISLYSPSALIPQGGKLQFTANSTDQFGQPMIPATALTWGVDKGGGCDANGLFTALSTYAGPSIVTATSGTVHASKTITVASVPVVTAITGTANAAATQIALALQATDSAGQSGLTYSWTAQVDGGPASYITFSNNYSNAAASTTATLNVAGTYVITGTATNANGQSAQKSVMVVVSHILTRLYIPSYTPVTGIGVPLQFTVQAQDQFYKTMTAPTVQWSVSGGGSIDQTGLYSSTAAASLVVVSAAYTGIPTATAQIAVQGHAPTFSTPASANPSVVTGSTSILSAVAVPFSGGALTYNWNVNPADGVTYVRPSSATDNHLDPCDFQQDRHLYLYGVCL